MKVKGDYPFYFSDYTLNLYTPTVDYNFNPEGEDSVHLGFFTQILYRRPRTGWSWHWSFVFRILGFGIGIAHQHCENPNWKKKASGQNLDCKK